MMSTLTATLKTSERPARRDWDCLAIDREIVRSSDEEMQKFAWKTLKSIMAGQNGQSWKPGA